jgi:LPS sulfotransferase NodH
MMREGGAFTAAARRLAFLARHRLRRSVLQAALRDGQSSYRRFILLGEGRSGSNFLRGLLNSHGRIVVYGELFRFFDSIGWEFPDLDRFLQSRRLLALSQRDPARFLQREVFGTHPRRIAAVGFKLFYYHAQDDGRELVWRFLKNEKSIAVIHLKRRNTLRAVLSLKKAFATNRWTAVSGPDADRLSIPLDYDECLERFVWAKETKERYDAYFNDHPMLDVTYERLCEDLDGQCRRIQEFLGVDQRPLRASTYKQAQLPLSTAITNYSELKARFAGTPWESFFEE